MEKKRKAIVAHDLTTAIDAIKKARDRKSSAAYYSARSLRLGLSPFEADELRHFDHIEGVY